MDVNDDTKLCRKCLTVKGADQFYVNKNGVPRSPCKDCWRTAKRQAYRENHTRENAKMHAANLARYDLTPEQYEAMLVAQGGKCAACGQVPIQRKATKAGGERRRFHVDHCHITGKVRGLICPDCNLALGYAHDTPWVLRSLAAYLERHAPVTPQVPPEAARLL